MDDKKLRKEYAAPTCDVVAFTEEDIVRTSGVGAAGNTWNQDPWGEDIFTDGGDA